MTQIKNFLKGFIASAIMIITLSTAVLSTSLVLTSVPANAQTDNCNKVSNKLPDFKNNCIKGLSGIKGDANGIASIIINIANFFIIILGAVSVLFIVYGGFLYVTDDGSGTKAGNGKKIVINALIGLVVALVSFTLVSLVVGFTTTADLSNATSSSSSTTGGGIQ
jgi:hypothetical protein